MPKIPSATRLFPWLGLLFICLVGPGLAQDQAPALEPVPVPVAARNQTPALEPGSAEIFLDGVMAAELKARHIPGACLALVKNGQTVLLKGYGQADLDKSLPVDPEKTLFRQASVSKVLVWTAIMQLAQQGKIDLKADVNAYLTEPRIPQAFGAPVTVADLMTHTAGFEETDTGISVAKVKNLVPLAQALRTHIPARIYPPGVILAYSNFGAALAGLIVRNVSGQPYQDYIAQHIFNPLGMNHSTFAQPLPEDWAPDLAQGYVYHHGIQQAKDFELIQLSPAGAMSSTAKDMAALLAAFLQGGQFQGEQILAPDTVKDMLARHFAMDPRVSGLGWGFYDWTTKGRRLVLHEGDTQAFHTLFALYPQQGLGLYLAFNGPGGAKARREVAQALLDHFFPGQEEQTPVPPGSGADLKNVSGWYEPTRAVHTGYSSVARLLGQVRVIQEPTGVSLWGLCKSADNAVYSLAGPNFYWNKYDSRGLAFATPADQEPICFYLSQTPAGYMKVTAWWDCQPFQIALVLVCFVVLASGYLSWPMVYLARRGENPARQHVPARAGWLALGTGLVLAGFFVIFARVLWASPLGLELTWWVKALLTLPYLAGLLALAMLGFLLQSLAELLGGQNKNWGWFGQIHYGLAVSSVGGLIWFLYHWNLLPLPFLG